MSARRVCTQRGSIVTHKHLTAAKGRLLKNVFKPDVFKGNDCFQAEGDSSATIFKLKLRAYSFEYFKFSRGYNLGIRP